MIFDIPDTTNVISATFVIDESDIKFNRQLVLSRVFRCEDGKGIRMTRDGGRYLVEEFLESSSRDSRSEDITGVSEDDIQHVGYTGEIMGYEK